MQIDATELAREIGTTVAQVVKTDLALLSGYSAAKTRSVAAYAVLVGEAYARGELDELTMQEEMAEIDRMLARFVRNLRALAATTAERLIGGLRALIFGTLARLAGLSGLVLPGTVFA